MHHLLPEGEELPVEFSDLTTATACGCHRSDRFFSLLRSSGDWQFGSVLLRDQYSAFSFPILISLMIFYGLYPSIALIPFVETWISIGITYSVYRLGYF